MPEGIRFLFEAEVKVSEFKLEEQELRQRFVGGLLKKARERAGLLQSDLAKELGYGSAQFISNWERGISLPPMDQLPKLIGMLGIPQKTLIDALMRYQKEHLKIQKRQLTELFRSRSR